MARFQFAFTCLLALPLAACGGIVDRDGLGENVSCGPTENCIAQDAGKDVPDVRCKPTLNVNVVWYASGDVPLGAKDVPMSRIELVTNDCGPVEVTFYGLQLSSPDASGVEDSTLFCKEPCVDPEDWNFGHVTATEGSGLMGPSEFYKAGKYSRTDVGDWDGPSNSRVVPSGITWVVEFRMNVATTEAVPLVGKRITLSPQTLAAIGDPAYGQDGLITPKWTYSATPGWITIVKP